MRSSKYVKFVSKFFHCLLVFFDIQCCRQHNFKANDILKRVQHNRSQGEGIRVGWGPKSKTYQKKCGGCPIKVVFKVLLTNIGTMVTKFKRFEGKANQTISKCVKLNKIIFQYDTTFHFGINCYIFGFCYFG